jgi:hypothetical protein
VRRLGVSKCITLSTRGGDWERGGGGRGRGTLGIGFRFEEKYITHTYLGTYTLALSLRREHDTPTAPPKVRESLKQGYRWQRESSQNLKQGRWYVK